MRGNTVIIFYGHFGRMEPERITDKIFTCQENRKTVSRVENKHQGRTCTEVSRMKTAEVKNISDNKSRKL